MAASAIASARATIGITGRASWSIERREGEEKRGGGGGGGGLLARIFLSKGEEESGNTGPRGRAWGGLENRFCRRISKDWGRGRRLESKGWKGGRQRGPGTPVNYLYQSLEIHPFLQKEDDFIV